MGIFDKISEFFKVKKPYPDWAYASLARRQLATLIDMAIVYPVAYPLFRYEIVPAFLRKVTDRTQDLSNVEQFALETYIEAWFSILALAGWWSIPLVLLIILAFFAIPLALYNLVLEASPLNASLGKAIQGFKVVKGNGDPITFWSALDRFGDRLLILGQLLDSDYDVVKRNAPRIN